MLFGLVAAMLITTALLNPLIQISRSHGLLVYPDQRRTHERAVPQVGGVAIFLGFLIPCIFFAWQAVTIAPYFFAVLVVMAAGLYDDFHELSYQKKLLTHSLAATCILFFTDLQGIQLGMIDGSAVDLGWLSFPVAFVLIVGVTNAVNLSDGLDGLAAGLVLMSALSLAVLAYASAELLPLALTIPLVGGLIGFLRFNAHPARIFMGDNGAYFLGFTLAYVVVVLASKDSNYSICALLCILGVPVYDTFSVALRRCLGGRNPFTADRSHIHHRFLEVGLSHDDAVLAVYLVHVALIGLGLGMLTYPDLYVAGALLMVVLVVEFAISSMAVWWPRCRELGQISTGWSSIPLAPAIFAPWVLGFPLAAVWALGEARLDFAVGALIAIAAVVISRHPQVQRRFGGDWMLVDRGALYLLGAFAVYLCSSTPELARDRPLVADLEWLWFAATTCIVVLVLITKPQGARLELTALDALILLCVSGASLLGDASVDGRSIGLLKLIVWFYAVELLLVLVPERRGSFIRWIALGTLVGSAWVYAG